MGEKYEILSEKYLRLYLKIVYVVIEVSDTVILYGGERALSSVRLGKPNVIAFVLCS